MNRKVIVTLLGAMVVLLFSVNLSANSIQLLSNTGFETPASGVTPGTPVTDSLNFTLGTTAAGSWDVFSNGPGTITTTLVPSTLAGGGSFMLEVNTTGNDGGLVEDFLSTPAPSATESAWLFIKSGCVGIGSGNDGDTGVDTSTCATGKWIQLTSPNGSTPVTAFIVYNISSGADFFVDNTSLLTGSTSTVPEPGALVLLGTGMLGLALFATWRQRRMA